MKAILKENIQKFLPFRQDYNQATNGTTTQAS
jgi:hypothetical protein